jgi:hypothetical protein
MNNIFRKIGNKIIHEQTTNNDKPIIDTVKANAEIARLRQEVAGLRQELNGDVSPTWLDDGRFLVTSGSNNTGSANTGSNNTGSQVPDSPLD